MLVEHILKVPFGLGFESDELHTESIGLLPPNDGKPNDNRHTGPREFNLQAEMRTSVVLDVGLDLATADRQIGQHTFPGPFITGKRDTIIHRHP